LKELKDWLLINDLSVAFDSLKDFGVDNMKDLGDIEESEIGKSFAFLVSIYIDSNGVQTVSRLPPSKRDD